MNVAIPEFDGRIITLPVSFMAPVDETNSVQYYEPVVDRVVQVAKQAAKLATLRHKPNSDKRIAFMLTNSSGKAERIGDAVGLDTPASIMKVFEAMKAAGYDFGEDGSLPSDGDELIQNLVDRCSYDEIYLTEQQLANAAGHVQKEVYQTLFDTLPQRQKDHIVDQWGKPPGEAYVHNDCISLAGLEFGNIFMALQPPRGYGMVSRSIYWYCLYHGFDQLLTLLTSALSRILIKFTTLQTCHPHTITLHSIVGYVMCGKPTLLCTWESMER